MAIYEFECQACGERFEMTMGIAEHERLKQEPAACPKCGKHETQQVVSTFYTKPPTSY